LEGGGGGGGGPSLLVAGKDGWEGDLKHREGKDVMVVRIQGPQSFSARGRGDTGKDVNFQGERFPLRTERETIETGGRFKGGGRGLGGNGGCREFRAGAGVRWD